MPPNTQKGEVELVAGEETYTMRLGFDCLERLEELTDRPIETIFAEFSDTSKPRLKLIRMVMWAALSEHHPELKLADVGHIITNAGLANVLEAFGRATKANFPQTGTAAPNGGDDPNPPPADDGTGQDLSAEQSPPA